MKNKGASKIGGVGHMEQRSFIMSLFDKASPEEAYWTLKERIDASNDEDITSFKAYLYKMIAEAQAGHVLPSLAVSPQSYFQGLNTIAYYTDQFLIEKRMLRLLEDSGQKSDSGLEQQLIDLYAQIADPAASSRVAEKIRQLGMAMGMKTPPDIGTCYRPGTTKFQLRWPLSSEQQIMLSSIDMQFDQLAHLNQFAILYKEWYRRWNEGNTALYAGDLDKAQKILVECVARAEQLEVNELQALSYESLMAVAQRLGDRTFERNWLDAALAAREKG